MYFRACRRVSFSYFPKIALDHRGAPQHLLKFSWIMIQYSVEAIQLKYTASKMEQLFVTKMGNSWKLLLAVVTESFVLNVTGFLDPTLIRQ